MVESAARRQHRLDWIAGAVCVGLALAGIVGFVCTCLTIIPFDYLIFVKPIPVWCIAVWFVLLTLIHTGPRAKLTPTALACVTFILYGIGDALLAVKSPDIRYFLVGGSCFLVGHLVLVCSTMVHALVAHGTLVPTHRSRVYLALLAALGTQATAVIMGLRVAEGVKNPTFGFEIYLYLSTFTITSVSGSLWWSHRGAVCASIVGSAVFLLSDVILFNNKFVKPFGYSAVPYVMSTYWAGCALFCLSVVLVTLSPRRAKPAKAKAGAQTKVPKTAAKGKQKAQ